MVKCCFKYIFDETGNFARSCNPNTVLQCWQESSVAKIINRFSSAQTLKTLNAQYAVEEYCRYTINSYTHKQINLLLHNLKRTPWFLIAENKLLVNSWHHNKQLMSKNKRHRINPNLFDVIWKWQILDIFVCFGYVSLIACIFWLNFYYVLLFGFFFFGFLEGVFDILCYSFFLIIATFCPVLKGSDEAGPLCAGFQTELFHGRHPVFGYSSICRELPLLHRETRWDPAKTM